MTVRPLSRPLVRPAGRPGGGFGGVLGGGSFPDYGFGYGTAAGVLLGNETSGYVFDAVDNQVLVRGGGLAPNYFDTVQNAITAGLLSFSRASTALFVGSNGLIQTAASGAWRLQYDITTLAALGYLSEPAATNLALWSNDFTNVAWVKTTMTAAATATGPDGVDNSASTLTATAGNAIALQTIVSGSTRRVTSCYIKRRTGSGTINLTQDNGVTWTPVTVTASWSKVAVPSATAANPIVGIQIVTNADAVDVAYFQHTTSTNGVATSPILTTSASATRAGDAMVLDLTQVPFSQTSFSIFSRHYSPLQDAGTSVPWAVANHTSASQSDTIYANLTSALTTRANVSTRWGGTNFNASKPGLNQNGLIRQAQALNVGVLIHLAVDGSSIAGTSGGATAAPTAVQDRMAIGADWTLAASANALAAPIDAIVGVPYGWTDAQLLARVS